MLATRLKNIQKIYRDFTGKNGEPGNEGEFYILESMWIMLCSEFEGSIKDLAEHYIDSVKLKKNIKDMHVCFLLKNFYGQNKKKITFSTKEIINIFKRKKSGITYLNFTKNKRPTYKSLSVESLFNSMGIFFGQKTLGKLKLLDGIASTRDSIAHGDRGIQITKKDLEEAVKIVKDIYKVIKIDVLKSISKL